MTAAAQTALPHAENGFWRLWRPVNRFFFQPMDTTTFGLVRLCAGLLVFYVHAVYSFEFQTFLGRNAWVNKETSDRIHHEAPVEPINFRHYWYYYKITDDTLDALRKGESYKITDDALNAWRKGNVPEGVLDKLRLLRDREFDSPEQFNKALEGVLSPNDRRAYGEFVLEQARVYVPESVLEKLRPLRDREFDTFDHFTAELQRALSPDDLKDYSTKVVQQATQWTDPRMKNPETAADRAYRDRWGYDRRMLFSEGQINWSVWYHVQDPTWMAIVHGLILASMLMFALGLFTPVTGVITWVAFLSYVDRAPTSFFGMDTMMSISLIYLMLGHLFARPSQNAFSLDRLIWRWRKSRGWLPPGAESEDGGRFPVAARAATRMIQIHFCIIYFGSGISKLLGSSWWMGNAIWDAVANPEFGPLHLRYVYETMRFVARHRWLWEIVTTGSVIYTLALEIGFPFLVWNRRLRWILVIGAALLHTGIALTMGLTGFGLIMLSMLIAFVPPETIKRVLRFTEEPEAAPRPSSVGPPLAAA